MTPLFPGLQQPKCMLQSMWYRRVTPHARPFSSNIVDHCLPTLHIGWLKPMSSAPGTLRCSYITNLLPQTLPTSSITSPIVISTTKETVFGVILCRVIGLGRKQCVFIHTIIFYTTHFHTLQIIIAVNWRTHGAMLVPVISGSDKTTVSVATCHQEYHPVYQSPGNVTNPAHRRHGNEVLPTTFLPIPKSLYRTSSFVVVTKQLSIVSKRQVKRPEFQCFVQQVYHMCLAQIFAPLKAGMTTPEVVCCLDSLALHHT